MATAKLKRDRPPAEARREAARLAVLHECVLNALAWANLAAVLGVPCALVRTTRAEPLPGFVVMILDVTLFLKLWSWWHCNQWLRRGPFPWSVMTPAAAAPRAVPNEGACLSGDSRDMLARLSRPAPAQVMPALHAQGCELLASQPAAAARTAHVAWGRQRHPASQALAPQRGAACRKELRAEQLRPGHQRGMSRALSGLQEGEFELIRCGSRVQVPGPAGQCLGQVGMPCALSGLQTGDRDDVSVRIQGAGFQALHLARQLKLGAAAQQALHAEQPARARHRRLPR